MFNDICNSEEKDLSNLGGGGGRISSTFVENTKNPNPEDLASAELVSDPGSKTETDEESFAEIMSDITEKH